MALVLHHRKQITDRRNAAPGGLAKSKSHRFKGVLGKYSKVLVLGRHHAGAMGDLLANALTRAGEERSMRRESVRMGEGD